MRTKVNYQLQKGRTSSCNHSKVILSSAHALSYKSFTCLQLCYYGKALNCRSSTPFAMRSPIFFFYPSPLPQSSLMSSSPGHSTPPRPPLPILRHSLVPARSPRTPRGYRVIHQVIVSIHVHPCISACTACSRVFYETCQMARKLHVLRVSAGACS